MKYSYSAPDKEFDHANFTALTQIFDSNFQNISTHTSNFPTLSTNLNSIESSNYIKKSTEKFIILFFIQ